MIWIAIVAVVGLAGLVTLAAYAVGLRHKAVAVAEEVARLSAHAVEARALAAQINHPSLSRG